MGQASPPALGLGAGCSMNPLASVVQNLGRLIAQPAVWSLPFSVPGSPGNNHRDSFLLCSPQPLHALLCLLLLPLVSSRPNPFTLAHSGGLGGKSHLVQLVCGSVGLVHRVVDLVDLQGPQS